MIEELELDLVKKDPKILRDYKGDMKVTCMAWGFQCMDGWYDLLEQLMHDIQNYCDDEKVQVVVDQIKEKFGTLRFYYHTGDTTDDQYDHIRDIVKKAETASAKICEKCGALGELRGTHWLYTACFEHKKK